MRINHNITALNTYNKLTANTAATSKSLEKLSSGLKINKAGDNAAGLAISEKMRGQIRGLDQASTNASDAISLINTAEGALSETHSILQRMRELAVQSSNDSNVTIDREEIQKEMNQLTSEINRIGNTTEFNTQKLLDGGGSKTISGTVLSSVTGGKAGSISAVSTVAESQTGKATTSVSFTNGDGEKLKLSFEAKEIGEDLNGYSFTFVSGDGTDDDVQRNVATNVITITANLATVTASDLTTLINSKGVVSKEINVTAIDTTDGSAFAGALSGDGTAALDTNSTTIMTGGEKESSRGVYSFNLDNAYVNANVANNNEFSIRIGVSGSPGGYRDITLGAHATTTNATQFAIGDADNRYTSAQQAEQIAIALNSIADVSNRYNVTSNGSTISLVEKNSAITGTDVEKVSSTGTAAKGVMAYTHTSQKVVETGGKFTIDGQDILVVDNTNGEYAAQIANGTAIDFGDAANKTASGQMTALAEAVNKNTTLRNKYSGGSAADSAVLTLEQKANVESREVATLKMSDKSGSGFTANFQIGANTAQSLTIDVKDMRSAALGVAGSVSGGDAVAKNGSIAKFTTAKDITDGTTNTPVEYALDVSTHQKATAAISVINDAIEAVSAERSKLGSYQNRLEHTINNLGTSSENLTTAESRIRDVDMAKEMMEFTKNNILSQAAQSMLAQANQQPQGVLQLLQ